MNGKRTPIWQTKPCPSWCAVAHTDSDARDDRQCFSGYRTIGRTLADTIEVFAPGADNVWQLDELRVGLEVGPRELIPHLFVSYGSGMTSDEDAGEYSLTLEEAEHLAAVLVAAIADARLSGAVTPDRPWATWQRAACPAWCSGEHGDADGVGARCCSASEHRIPLSLEETLTAKSEWFANTVAVSIERDLGEIEARVLVYLGTGSGVELTCGEAEEFAATLMQLSAGAIGTPLLVEPKGTVCSKFGAVEVIS